MSSLEELQKLLEKYDPEGTLKGISYDRTWNESLGFAGPSDFHVGIPYNPWPKDISQAPKNFESVLALAFKDTLKRGLEASTTKEGELFIDITQLNGNWFDFWNQRNGVEHQGVWLARAVGDMIKNLPETVTPVIRFLIGSDGDTTADIRWKGYMEGFNKTFWRNGEPNGEPNWEPICTHPNAKLCVGLYSPNFKSQLDPDTVTSASGSIDSLVQIVRDMVDKIFLVLDLIPDVKKQHDAAVNMLKKENVIKNLATFVLPSISWNHAKILAVDGKTLMTGGANYWKDYADNEHAISDLQCKVKGDAAISAHSYCDYFWRYLNKLHSTDDNSFRRTAQLNQKGSVFWDTNTQIPLFRRKPTNKSGKSVLSVAKLGDWTGSMDKLEYPVQIVDAIRDLVLNVLFRIFWTTTGGAFVRVFKTLTLPSITDDKMMASYQKAGITPTAWASRIARCQAITHAKQAVYIDAEIFGCFLQQDDSNWKLRLKEINETFKLTDKSAWDGVIWPYDLISALATFMNNVLAKDGNGVFILLTSPKSDSETHNGWEDQPAANEFKQRLRWLAGRPWLESDAEYDKWFNARCTIRRISNDGSRYNHCKVVCCDRKLLYIGSDNPYPNYNEEHGMWVDDKEAIDGWFERYWNRKWEQSPAADMRPEAGKFASTMT